MGRRLQRRLNDFWFNKIYFPIKIKINMLLIKAMERHIKKIDQKILRLNYIREGLCLDYKNAVNNVNNNGYESKKNGNGHVFSDMRISIKINKETLDAFYSKKTDIEIKRTQLIHNNILWSGKIKPM